MASASPRRRAIMGSLGLRFSVVAPQVEEGREAFCHPAELAEKLAVRKARAVINRVCPPAIIIGADTIVVHQGEILGKPATEQEARAMLMRLQGTEHEVITGVAVLAVPEGRCVVDHAVTKVFFAPLTEEEIAAYVATGEPMDKAGAYAAQGKGALFLRRLEGCYFNVVGLPVFLLHQLLIRCGVNLLTGQGSE
ncbi:Maf family protein [Desulfothermobacter acidiphilus]|uniref:Maf family protein n=1 Tax=Desulfothermobacter acidiphilus TaxID=1938353 RepID=UPI003F8CCF69